MAQGGQGMTRRDLLRATMAAGAGLVAAPTILAATDSAPSATAPAEPDLAVALVGCGTQGLVLIDQAVKIPGVRFKAVCDIWPYSQRYATGRLEAYGQKPAVYADFGDLLTGEKGLDAVLIATPDAFHAEHATACLKAGLHVYCEEPMAPTLAEARGMVLASRAAKRVLAVGYQRRSSPRYLAARDYLTARKACGSVLAVQGQWNRLVGAGRGWPKDQALPPETLKKYGYDTMDQLRDWLWYEKFSAGPMVRMGGRQLDVFNWFLGGPPRAVLATAARHATAKTDWPDAYAVLLEYDVPLAGGGRQTILGRYQLLQGSSHLGYYEEVTGDEGCLRVSEAQPPARLIRETGADTPAWEKDLAGSRLTALPEMLTSGSIDPDEDEVYVQPPSYALPPSRDYLLPVKERPLFQPHLENFFDAVRKGSPVACPGEAGYQALATALAVTRSVKSQARVELKAEDYVI
jgi:predicted dehydrogenase